MPGDGSITEITKDNYLLRWYEPDPRSHQRSLRFHGKKEDAAKELRRIQVMVEAGKCQPSAMTVNELSERFIDERILTCRARTIESYDDTLNAHILPVFGKLQLIQVSSIALKKYLIAKRDQISKNGRPFSEVSIKDMHTVLKMLFYYGIKQRCLDVNPANFKLPNGDQNAPPDLEKVQDQTAPVLTPASRQRFINAAVDDEFYVAFCIAVENGKRRGEILGIKWLDIDFHTGKIMIYKSLQRQRGQGIKAGPLKGKKNGEKKVSFIVVGPQVLDLLKQHRERQLEIQDAMGERNHDEGWVFCRADNGKPYDPKTFYKHFKKICADIGLSPSLKLHNLRDDYTTARVDRGDSIEAISADLDHESITTTMGYVHETYEQKKKAALDMERNLHFPEPPGAGQH